MFIQKEQLRLHNKLQIHFRKKRILLFIRALFSISFPLATNWNQNYNTSYIVCFIAQRSCKKHKIILERIIHTMITGKKSCVATIKDEFIRQCHISNKVIIHRVDFLINGEWFLKSQYLVVWQLSINARKWCLEQFC